jgi:hypothetical protein
VPYRLSFFIPHLVLLAGLLASLEHEHNRRSWNNRLLKWLAYLSCGSWAVATLAYLPPILARRGNTATTEQPHSTNHFAPIDNSKLQEISAACGLSNRDSLQRLYVDEHTYWHFRNTKQPVFFTYVGFAESKVPEQEIWRRVVAGGASGLVAMCSSIERVASSTQMTRNGDLCCASRQTLEALAGSPAQRDQRL